MDPDATLRDLSRLFLPGGVTDGTDGTEAEAVTTAGALLNWILCGGRVPQSTAEQRERIALGLYRIADVLENLPSDCDPAIHGERDEDGERSYGPRRY
jgi:hypothetical protein